MRQKSAIVLIILGIAFLIWAVLGRYIVLPGYLESLESGAGQGGVPPAGVAGWKIARYLIWAFSFKLGIYFVALGALLRTAISRRKFALLAAGGLLYIALAYAPLPGPSWLFGIGGVLMTVFIVLILLRLADERDREVRSPPPAVDLRIVAYFFFAMATYTLCGLLGVRTFALDPAKMIQYGLQADAVSFAAHALSELALGWLFILLSHRRLWDTQ